MLYDVLRSPIYHAVHLPSSTYYYTHLPTYPQATPHPIPTSPRCDTRTLHAPSSASQPPYRIPPHPPPVCASPPPSQPPAAKNRAPRPPLSPSLPFPPFASSSPSSSKMFARRRHERVPLCLPPPFFVVVLLTPPPRVVPSALARKGIPNRLALVMIGFELAAARDRMGVCTLSDPAALVQLRERAPAADSPPAARLCDSPLVSLCPTPLRVPRPTLRAHPAHLASHALEPHTPTHPHPHRARNGHGL